jgi:hypothetical protein
MEASIALGVTAFHLFMGNTARRQPHSTHKQTRRGPSRCAHARDRGTQQEDAGRPGVVAAAAAAAAVAGPPTDRHIARC